MTEPASAASESPKAVPVGEPPTPEGWTIYVCGNCRSNDIQESNENDSLCADCGEWMNVEEVRVAPVGGAGQGLRVHEVYDGLEGQKRVALVDATGRIFHCDLEAAGVGGTGVRPNLTREELGLVLRLMTDSDLDWAAYAPPHGKIGRLHDGVVAKLRAASVGGDDG